MRPLGRDGAGAHRGREVADVPVLCRDTRRGTRLVGADGRGNVQLRVAVLVEVGMSVVVPLVAVSLVVDPR
jgi:hypothetical protein